MRSVRRMVRGREIREGAGVKLRRLFADALAEEFDPFLLFDAFDSTDPEEYLPGFPWHPHRGIETVTYLLSGVVEHGDSLGNRGTIASGCCQWMTAGRGIVHQEMPQAHEHLHGIQLWVNLPADKKMTEPVYRDLQPEDMPLANTAAASVRVLAGSFADTHGPVEGIAVAPTFLDVNVEPHGSFVFDPEDRMTVFAYVFSGNGCFAADQDRGEKGDIVLWDQQQGEIAIEAGASGLRFLLCAGRPLREPIVWGGPIVMNTRKQIEEAFAQLDEGTFLEQRP